MIPQTYPSVYVSPNGETAIVVALVTNVTGLQRWVDYIPVQFKLDVATPTNSYANNGAVLYHQLLDVTGKVAGTDYIRIYEDLTATTAWSSDANGYIPIISAAPDFRDSATFFAPLTSSLALSKGTGSATFTRATTATVMGYAADALPGASQVLLTVDANEARFEGARRRSSLVGVGTQPFGVAHCPTTDRMYVANYGASTVSVINPTTNTVVAVVAVGTNPVSVAHCPTTDRMYVANNTSNNVSVINPATNTTSADWSETFADGTAIPDATLKGVLIEEARTNLLTYSEQFDNGAWVKASSTVTANAIVAPDGTLTADKFVPNNGAATAYIVRVTTPTAVGAYIHSVYAKSGELTSLRMDLYSVEDGNTSSVFNLATGAITSGSGVIVSVGSGWYRCSLQKTWTGLTNAQCQTARNTVTGDGTSGIYLWGAQLELGNFASSYIPTTTAAVARNADVLLYPTAGNAIAALGSASVEWTPEATMPVGTTAGYGNNTFIDLGTYSSSMGRYNGALYLTKNGALLTDTPAFAAAQGTKYKSAGIFGNIAWKGCVDGVFGVASGIQTGNTIGSNIIIGLAGSLAAAANGNLRNVRIWQTALTDTQLQSVTT